MYTNYDYIYKNTKLVSKNGINIYADYQNRVYTKLINHLYKQIHIYTKDNVGLVVGILNSGKKPAVDLANLFKSPLTYVEYHMHRKTGNKFYPKTTIKTKRGDITYPLEIGEYVGTKIKYSMLKQFKINNKLANNIVNKNQYILIIDDSSSAGHNNILAVNQINSFFNNKYKNIIYATLDKSIFNPFGSPYGCKCSNYGFKKSFCGLVTDSYSHFSKNACKNANVFSGLLYFPNISGANRNFNEHIKKLQNGKRLYNNVTNFYI